MVSYKEPCIHCAVFIERDSKVCASCGSRNPFAYICPSCRRIIRQNENLCGGCGRYLWTACPHCWEQTFIGADKCGHCNKTLLVRCENSRCGEPQFFENKGCMYCGRKIKTAMLQLSIPQ